MRGWIAAIVAALTTIASRPAADGRAEFIAWARQHAHPLSGALPGPSPDDLEPLRSIVGSARIVGVGESIHGITEFLGLRQRSAEYLIERLGFTAVAIESGLPESRMVADYVAGGDAPPGMWTAGFTWTMASFQGTRDLVEWMRAWNQNPAHRRKIHFYGMDVAGGNGSWLPAVQQVLTYLERVEPAFAPVVRDRLVPLVTRFARPGFTEANDAYSALPPEARNAVAALANELADRFDLLRVKYLAAATKEEYDWARQIALNLRYANTMLTNYEAKGRVNPVWNGRDLAMAHNVRWILDREGPGAGVVVLAHNAHVQTAMSVQVDPAMASLGVLLRSVVGDGYRNVGFTFDRGSMPGEAGKTMELAPADSASIDGTLARVGRPLFLLDLGQLPAGGEAARWLDQPLKQRIQEIATEYNERRSWNGLFFVDRITPSKRPD
jgi:erythromycin esterase